MGQKLFKEGKTKTPFCNNPKCELHKHMVEPSVGRIEVSKPGVIIGTMSKKPFTRDLFQSADGERHAFFCEVCVSAIDTAQRAVGDLEKLGS